MSDIYTARNSEQFKHHKGVPERYREGYCPPNFVTTPARLAQERRDARSLRLQIRLARHMAVMRDGTRRQRVGSELLLRLFAIREAENMEALQRRYLALLDQIDVARVGGVIDLAHPDRLQKLALNAANARSDELVPLRK